MAHANDHSLKRVPMNIVELAVGFWCYTFGGVGFVVLGCLLLFVFVQHLQLASGGLVGWVQLHHLCKHSDSFIILMKINQRQAYRGKKGR